MAAGWWILHVDMDTFIVAVEVRRRPELRGLPVVVGGDGDPTQRRKVAAGVSYEARAFGVRSGTPLREALRRCPDAVFLPTDAPAYEAASAEVMDALRSLPVLVEVLGWDEAFLGATTDDPEDLARLVQRTVLERTGLACSVGVGDSKQRAKVATGFAKPAGVARLDTTTWMPVMGERPVTALWGVGPRMSSHLAELGITTVAQLAAADPDELARRFGPHTGPWYVGLARGGNDATIVTEPWVARSRSRETTYPADLTDPEVVAEQVTTMARELTVEVAGEGRTVVRVGVKVRTASFFTRTKTGKLPEPTTDPDAVAARALEVLARFELDRPVRLLGVRVELDRP